MWKAFIHRKRKYSDVLPCDAESYAALAAMQGGSAATLPPSLDALRAFIEQALVTYTDTIVFVRSKKRKRTSLGNPVEPLLV
ncbi:jg7727 [Pararge aegeria aegeria]|uniref:Jg7727 protein n=1 Tax=Pararge aegeria aegeria TaxID=348720 RepID=A0A8S4RPS3_9NEOP|nr:jg7727 [Pararge aegeria aegeria]